jgi:hypothetical protein
MWFQPLNLKCDFLVSEFAFKFNLYRYRKGDGAGVHGRPRHVVGLFKLHSIDPERERRLVTQPLNLKCDILVSKACLQIQLVTNTAWQDVLDSAANDQIITRKQWRAFRKVLEVGLHKLNPVYSWSLKAPGFNP